MDHRRQCGGIDEGIDPPGDMVIPDQFIDRTVGRASTFFSDGIVGHIGFATRSVLFEPDPLPVREGGRRHGS